MYRTPSRRGGRGGRGGRAAPNTPFTPRKRGLFEDGKWLCECRKPARFFTVKKEGPNKGKHFYTCETKKCDFFLWENDAKARELEALVTHNCPSENGIVGRIQAKGDPPATPVSAAPPKTARQQRLFFATGAPAARRASVAMSQDSDHLDYNTDEDEPQQAQAQAQEGLLGHRRGASSSSQTMDNSSGSKSFAPTPMAPLGRMPDFRSQAAAAAAGTPSAKRQRPVFLPDSDEEFGGGSLDDSDVERELAAAADESVRRRLFQTPAAERTVDRIDGGGLPTPMTRTNRNSLLIADEDREPSSKRPRVAGPPGSDPDSVKSPSPSPSQPAGQGQSLYIDHVGTPTPYRKTDALAPPSPSGPETPALIRAASPVRTPATGGDYPKVADEVMALLATQPVSEATKRSVRQALERHELRVKGVAKGRDVARAALEARHGRIAELQAHVVALENARRFDRARLRELRDGLLNLTHEEEL